MKTLFLSLLLVVLLAGCSMIDLAYNNAPGFVAGRIQDAFDLDSDQADLQDQRMQNFFAWHRAEELDRYGALLMRTTSAADDGIDAEEFLDLNEAVRSVWLRTMERLIDDLGDLALTLTPQQVASFDRYFRERSERFTDYIEMTPQQREIHRVERDLERLEKWFGDFDYFLEKKVRARLQDLPEIYPPWMRFREQRHAAILQALNNADNETQTRSRLKYLLLSPDTDFAREFEPARLAYWQALAQAMEDISGWLEPRHRETMQARLEDYTRAVERLSNNS